MSYRRKQKTDPIMAAALKLVEERIDAVEFKVKDWESNRNITIISLPDN